MPDQVVDIKEVATRWRRSIDEAPVEVFGVGGLHRFCALHYVLEENQDARDYWYGAAVDMSNTINTLMCTIWSSNDNNKGQKVAVLEAVDKFIADLN